KLTKFDELMYTFPDPIGLGPTFALTLIVLAEIVFALLVVLGVWTRLSTIPLIIGMAVAVFVAHGDDILGKGETGLIYMTAFIAIFLIGGGRFSLDRIAIGRTTKPARISVGQQIVEHA